MKTEVHLARRLSPRDRRALLWGAVILGATLLGQTLVRPWVRDIRDLRASAAQQRDLLERELGLLSAMSGAPRMQQQAATALRDSRVRLLEGDSVAATAALTAYVGDVASAAGIALTRIEGRPPATDAATVRVTADVRGTGTFAHILTFLRTIESAGPLLHVQALRIERGARGGPLGSEPESFSATISGLAKGDR